LYVKFLLAILNDAMDFLRERHLINDSFFSFGLLDAKINKLKPGCGAHATRMNNNVNG